MEIVTKIFNNLKVVVKLFYINSLYSSLIDQISRNSEAFRLANLSFDGFGNLLSMVFYGDENVSDIKRENCYNFKSFGLNDDIILTLQLVSIIFKADLFIYQVGKFPAQIKLDVDFCKQLDILLFTQHKAGSLIFGSILDIKFCGLTNDSTKEDVTFEF